MEHDGHRERLRARFRKEGMGGFAAHEALELLLTYAIPRVDVNPIAHRLIRRFGSLHAVLEAEPEETCQVEGVGPSAALLLHMWAGKPFCRGTFSGTVRGCRGRGVGKGRKRISASMGSVAASALFFRI